MSVIGQTESLCLRKNQIGSDDGGDETTVENTAGSNETPRVVLVVLPIDDQQQKLRADESGYEDVEAEVP